MFLVLEDIMLRESGGLDLGLGLGWLFLFYDDFFFKLGKERLWEGRLIFFLLVEVGRVVEEDWRR